MNCQTSNILYQVALVVKNLSANAGDAGGPGLIPGLGVGNGNPLWYSCLENSIDRGAWWATVHGVAKNQTWLSDWEHKQTHTTVQGLAQDEDTETDRIGQGFKSLINRTQWWILKKGWGKRHPQRLFLGDWLDACCYQPRVDTQIGLEVHAYYTMSITP